MQKLRIIFMGTPEFAVPTLEALIKNECQVLAVVTAPDKPQGRGQKIMYSPVKECALKYNVPLLQPTNLKDPQFLNELKNYQANLQVVVAFRMLPESVWAMPTLGTINLHASLLPQYRGAAPIHWAIINGEKETGATTFFLKHEIDTGSIIFQEKEEILEDDTAGTLYERLMKKGADLVLKTVKAIAQNNYPSVAQPTGVAIKHAPKIFKENCEISWFKTSEEVRNFVRGLSPYPAAWTTIAGKTYKVFKVSLANAPTTPDLSNGAKVNSPGNFYSDNKTYLRVKTADGWIGLEEFQLEGKKRMNVLEFFRGNRVAMGNEQ